MNMHRIIQQMLLKEQNDKEFEELLKTLSPEQREIALQQKKQRDEVEAFSKPMDPAEMSANIQKNIEKNQLSSKKKTTKKNKKAQVMKK